MWFLGRPPAYLFDSTDLTFNTIRVEPLAPECLVQRWFCNPHIIFVFYEKEKKENNFLSLEFKAQLYSTQKKTYFCINLGYIILKCVFIVCGL